MSSCPRSAGSDADAPTGTGGQDAGAGGSAGTGGWDAALPDSDVSDVTDSGEPDSGDADAGPPVCADADKRCAHVFTYPFAGQTSVEVRGDFMPNGWNVGLPMTVAGSAWTATATDLPWGSSFQYKFVVDGTSWQTDPANPNTTPDGVGGFNSVVPSVTCSTWTCVTACHPVINEVAVAGPGGAADELIEVFNPCTSAVDLSGWKLAYRSAAGTSDVIMYTWQSYSLPANGYYLVVGSGYSLSTPGDGTIATGGLSAAGGGLSLRNAQATSEDSVALGTATNAFVEGAPASAPPSGSTIARKPNGADTDHNDADSAVVSPSPKAAN